MYQMVEQFRRIINPLSYEYNINSCNVKAIPIFKASHKDQSLNFNSVYNGNNFHSDPTIRSF